MTPLTLNRLHGLSGMAQRTDQMVVVRLGSQVFKWCAVGTTYRIKPFTGWEHADDDPLGLLLALYFGPLAQQNENSTEKLASIQQ
jgi:hypothetical protein